MFRFLYELELIHYWFRDYTNVDAVQTYRIREIRGSPLHAFYGRTSMVKSRMVPTYSIRLILGIELFTLVFGNNVSHIQTAFTDIRYAMP